MWFIFCPFILTTNLKQLSNMQRKSRSSLIQPGIQPSYHSWNPAQQQLQSQSTHPTISTQISTRAYASIS